MHESLRLIQEWEQKEKPCLQPLREAIAIGEADIEAGHYVPFSDSASLRAHIASLANREKSSH